MTDIVIYIAAILLIAITVYLGFNWHCSSRAEIMGFEYKFGIPYGCMIEHQPGQWIAMDRYRAFDE